jgi:hypothetical protein
MGNRFNYRCPQCGNPDEIEICALVGLRLTRSGAEIADVTKDIDGTYWTADNAAGCDACGFQGAVKDFEPAGGATVIQLFPTRRAGRR